MQFRIEKHLGREPNTCTITITNLAQDSRISFCRKPLHVRIDAGYIDTGARQLFSGDLQFGHSTLKDQDWETKLQVGDGARAYANARTNRSFTAPVSFREVLAYAAGTMNLQLPPEIEQSPELAGALANGVSLHGPTRDILTRLLAPYGYHWSVQNSKLQIIRDDQILANEAILVNASNGLIGSPERAPPEKVPATGFIPVSANLETNARNSGSEVTFNCLLYPEIVPGGTVRLESTDITGTFKVIQVSHIGDTRGLEWQTEVKCVPQ